jgi:ADP-ribosylglycohydrolase
MIATLPSMRERMHIIIDNKEQQGHVVHGLHAELDALPHSYDAHLEFAKKLAEVPLRQDWPYVEPNDLEAIWAECDPDRPLGPIAPVDLADSARRVEAAFLGRVAGCILGKPLEMGPSLDDIQAALEGIGDWPLNDYVSERVGPALPRPLNPSWTETVRERIRYVAADDDLNYTVLGMLLLEQHGLDFTRQQIRDLWLHHLPVWMTFGPERTMLLRAGINTQPGGDLDALDEWVTVLNHGDEQCGALIRADAFGYACPGNPALASELAWRDASWTHRRTGIYGEMFVSAAIAAALVMDDRLGIFELALKFVPQRSRFYEVVSDSLAEVGQATDWLDGYRRIHAKYRVYDHCLIYQETGTLINTLRFAKDVGHGICLQVSQGNDTDSFGATAGSLLGALMGAGHLEDRWLEPFKDVIHLGLARFHEQSLSRLAQRMAELPRLVAEGRVRPGAQ